MILFRHDRRTLRFRQFVRFHVHLLFLSDRGTNVIFRLIHSTRLHTKSKYCNIYVSHCRTLEKPILPYDCRPPRILHLSPGQKKYYCQSISFQSINSLVSSLFCWSHSNFSFSSFFLTFGLIHWSLISSIVINIFGRDQFINRNDILFVSNLLVVKICWWSNLIIKLTSHLSYHLRLQPSYTSL